jgi:glucosamine-6-phosphate deaminase
MKISRYDDLNEVAAAAANLIIEQVELKPDSVLSLPTGRTPQSVYRILVEQTCNRYGFWDQVKWFQLDEYFGVRIFQGILESQLYRPLGICADKIFTPGGEYENAIKRAGGLDLVVLGIGLNGHIAFNEPGSPQSSRTRVVELSADTIAANRYLFDATRPISTKESYAWTMGIATIKSARKILLLAGPDKEKIVNRMLEADCKGSELPAAYLRRHPNFNILTTVSAPDLARALKLDAGIE